MSVLRFENVSKQYPGGHEALADVSFEVAQGEMLFVTGHSGAGKSTLLHLLGGLDTPTSGEVYVTGQKMSALSDGARGQLRNRALGFIYQFHHLLPEFTALENVMMPGIIEAGQATAEAEAFGRELLARVGLAGAEHKRPGELSGGMQQRVAIARALSLRPRLILADEPTGNLDTVTADEVFGLLREFNQDHGSACLIVTHDPRLAARCDRPIVLVDGRLTTQG